LFSPTRGIHRGQIVLKELQVFKCKPPAQGGRLGADFSYSFHQQTDPGVLKIFVAQVNTEEELTDQRS